VTVALVAAGATGVTACGLDFDRFEPPGGSALEGGADASRESGPDASSDGRAGEGGAPDASVDSAAGNDAVAGPDAAPDTGAPDVAQESAPPACPLGSGIAVIQQAPGPITIDGDLTEWGNPPVTVLAASDAALIQGPTGTCTAADATTTCLVPAGETAEALLLRDATNLYVGVRVTEPTIGGTNTTDPYYDDAVEIYLRADATATGDYTSADHQYVVDWQNLVIDYGPPSVGAGLVNPPGVKTAVKVAPSNKQYVVEMSIALGQLGLATLGSGQTLGFDFGVDHGQGTSATRSFLVWWMATHGAPSCTTAKCTGCNPDQPYCDTLDFGVGCAE
jgi:hypothetical protein